MKILMYITGSAIIMMLFLLFYLNTVSSNTSNNLPVDGNQNLDHDFIQNGNNQSSFSPQSGGWQLQTMPNMGNRLVRDLYFTDSLTGYAVASPDAGTDSAHILKTTNGGNNWLIKSTWAGRLPRIIFLNSNTGFAGGNYLLKTTNAGENWMVWNWPLDRIIFDMQVFSEDTIWYADRFSVGGGAFRTTNGGVNWEKRDSGIPANSYPDRIYFYNSRIGFATGNTNVYKTTDAGLSWAIAFTGGYSKIQFLDSLNGFKTAFGFYRTIDGGYNWSKDSLPKILGNTITIDLVTNFTFINKDTIYSSGSYVYYNSNGIYRSTIYKTTNGGLNWGYQIPDTSYHVIELRNMFSYKNKVWGTDNYVYNRLLYSPTGGDSTVYLGINLISNEVPNNFDLYQNYPNPFNPTTNIKYKILKSSVVRINVMDILGRKVQILVNEKHTPGTYQISFDGNSLPSGIYFYQLIVDNEIMQTRRMALLK